MCFSSSRENKVSMSSTTEKVALSIEGQKWIVFNMVGPGLRQQVGKKSAIRFLGVFDDCEDPSKPKDQLARDFADEYKKRDDRFDIYVAKAGEFLPILNEVHEVGEVKYSHREINDLLEVHDRTRTQTEDWNRRIENAKLTKKDGWAEFGQ